MSDKQKNSVIGLGIITVICLIIFTNPNNNRTLFKSALSVPFFPVQRTPTKVSVQALISGPLKLEDKCLKVEGNLIVWPYGFSIGYRGNKMNIVNQEGKIVASVGDSIKLSGGQASATASNSLSQFTNTNCKGPLWITGKVLGK